MAFDKNEMQTTIRERVLDNIKTALAGLESDNGTVEALDEPGGLLSEASQTLATIVNDIDREIGRREDS